MLKKLFSALLGTFHYQETPLDNEFLNFINKHNKQYQTIEEYNFRKEIFQVTFDTIVKLNAASRYSNHGINVMADWTEGEKIKKSHHRSGSGGGVGRRRWIGKIDGNHQVNDAST